MRLASEMHFQTLEALGEAIAVGLLARFALMGAVAVSVSKFSPPIPHALRKVGIRVQMTREELSRRS